MTLNLYCNGCLRTRSFLVIERGYVCPCCRRTLLRTGQPGRDPESNRFRPEPPRAAG